MILTQDHIADKKDNLGMKYGYWWYRRKNAVLALGWGGQAVAIYPELKLVAVVTTSDKSVSGCWISLLFLR